ncbi:MAG: HlyD family efflux transporter periplasmic adaptor subunit [Pirellulaceae bacterium]
MAFLWRIFVACGLIWAAEQLFFGAGVILAVLAALAWFGRPLLQLLRFVCFGSPLEQPNRWQFAASVVCMLGVTCALACAPNPLSFSAPAVVTFASPDSLNSNMSGTVVQLLVPDGITSVKQGDPIVQLENVEVEHRIQVLEAELKVAEAKQRIAFREKSPVDLRIQRQIVSAYQRELQEALRDRDELCIVAPADGNVFMSDANALEGQFATPATPLCGFGAHQALRIHAYVTQDRRQEIQCGNVVTIRCHGQPTIVGKIENIVPTAVHSIPPSLSAINGGPIAVQVGSTDKSGDATHQPIDKLFLIAIVPNTTTLDGWIPGRTGTVFLDTTNTIGQTVWHTATQWVENRRGHAG